MLATFFMLCNRLLRGEVRNEMHVVINMKNSKYNEIDAALRRNARRRERATVW